MKAAWYTRQGKAREVLEIGELPDPQAAAGEVVVRLHASGINPSDVKTRQGMRGGMAFPRIVPHSDGAGVIEAVGAGVDAARVGERVWVFNGQWRRAQGTAAERIALPVAQTAPLPEGTSFLEGACLGIPAMTAHRCLFADGAIAGQTILVTGGAGSVGLYAVQLARWAGARVLATVSSAEKERYAREAGAEIVIDYKRENVVERVREETGGAGVDRVVDVDLGGNLAVTRQVLKSHGVVAAYASMGAPEPALPVYPLMVLNATIHFVLVYELPEKARQAAVADIGRWLAGGTPRHTIAERRPLADVAAAHQHVESGAKIGQVVLEI